MEDCATKDNKIRVCMVAPISYPEYAGGSMQALRLSRRLAQRGIEVMLLTRNNRASMKIELVDGIYTYRLPKVGNDFLGDLLFSVAVFLFLLRKYGSYDLVHIHSTSLYTHAAILASRVLRKTSMVKISCAGADDPLSIRRRRLWGGLQYKIFSLADRVVAPSPETKDLYRQSLLPMDKLVEITNGTDIEYFRPVSNDEKRILRQKLGLPQDEAIVSFVGIICRRKGVDLLIKAMAEVVAERPSTRLLLIGPFAAGPEGQAFQQELQAQIERAKLTSRVIFAGYVGNVNEYLQAFDIFVLPSRQEGMPNSVLEAMSCGLPCVAMETSCVSGIITDRVNGLVFEAENSLQLAQNILYLLKNPDYAQQLSKEARTTILARFSLESIAEQYIQLYKKLVHP